MEVSSDFHAAVQNGHLKRVEVSLLVEKKGLEIFRRKKAGVSNAGNQTLGTHLKVEVLSLDSSAITQKPVS